MTAPRSARATAQGSPANTNVAAAVGNRQCANCRTWLLGPHCHACGQPARNPLGRLRDAVADLSANVLDIDGRLLRTLRDLLVPGRLALNYLAGQRARYVAPPRLFVVLSVLTFFVAHLVTGRGGVPLQFTDMDNSAIAAAASEGALDSARRAQLAILAGKRAELAALGGGGELRARLDAREDSIERVTRARRAALRQARAAGVPPPPPQSDLDAFKVAGKPWHPGDNPVRFAGLPAFANKWVNQRLGHGITNVRRYLRDQDALKQAWLASIPTALFFLVPVFALLLKLAYLRSPRTWLEHLVVALCSHALVLLAGLVAMLVVLATRASGVPGSWQVAAGVLGLATAIYLLLMQKTVYRQGWPATLLKFSVLGVVYGVLLAIGGMLALGAVFLR